MWSMEVNGVNDTGVHSYAAKAMSSGTQISHQLLHNDDEDGGNDNESDLEEDENERRCIIRERNKEHARKTRARKKEQLQTLRDRMNQLEEESRLLKQSIHECGVASILVGLSGGGGSLCPGRGGDKNKIPSTATTSAVSLESNISPPEPSGFKRMRFHSLDKEESMPQMELNIKGQVTSVGGTGREGKTQINWKTGVYIDENCKTQQLTKSELETLR